MGSGLARIGRSDTPAVAIHLFSHASQVLLASVIMITLRKLFLKLSESPA